MLAVALAALGLALVTTSGLPAESGVICNAHSQTCTVTVETPPTPAGSTGGASSDGARVCVAPRGEVVPCFSDRFGWFNDADGCYYDQLSPKPEASDPLWEGHYPAGSVYAVTCGPMPFNGPGGGWVWLADPPPGFGDMGITPAQLAQRAADQMRLTGPAIHLTIDASEVGLVGIPTWLWTDVTPTTWGPNSATASVPGLSVTATARATRVVWDMGDGNTKVCTNPGTPYVEGAVHSPTCDYVYQQSSAGQPDDAYRVTATTTWQVDWSGGGTSGSLTLTRSSATTVRIGELQVLVTG